MSPLLQMRGVTKRFPGVVANRGINLEVERGEIHGLLGENGAGKTTLMNVLYGLLQPDEGSIEIGGKPATIKSPRSALHHGIGMVHQHFMLVPDMTVAENVALGLRANRSPLSRLNEVSRRVAELSKRYGLNVNPEDRVEDLTVGMQQRVEILRLLYRGAELLVLDEPTSVLTPLQWEDLAGVLRSLVAQGKAAILITHKLHELLSVADRCTVLRDGAVVATVAVRDVTKASLARMMVGREVVLSVDRRRLKRGRPVLEVRNLALLESDGRATLDDITFEVKEHEILGVAGVEKNGQHELVEVLTGLRPLTSGTILLHGHAVDGMTPRKFAGLSGAVIPEDRHRMALALDLPLMDNLIMRTFSEQPLSRRGILNRGRIKERCEEMVKKYDIRTPSTMVRMRQLSGGNQQKAVLAREFQRRPKLLVAAQPARGLDVGATEYVYRRLLEHREDGGATLLISTELDEILCLSDRIAVMVNGRILRILEGEEVDSEVLGLLMAGETVA